MYKQHKQPTNNGRIVNFALATKPGCRAQLIVRGIKRYEGCVECDGRVEAFTFIDAVSHSQAKEKFQAWINEEFPRTKQ
jgi:hypothetical protein